MIDAGLPLVQCLDILGNQEEHKYFQQVILQTRTDVEGGQALAEAMKSHPRVFDALYTNMIAAGEAGGILDTILKRLAVYIEKAVKLKGQVQSAMIYPIAVIVIAGAVVGVILWKVIPTFASLFAGLGAELPLPTRIVIALSNNLVRFMPFLIVLFVGGSYALRQYYATEKGRRVVDGTAAEDADSRPDPAQDRRGALLPHAVDADGVGRPHPRRPGHHRPHVRQRHHRGRDPGHAQEHRTRRDHLRAAEGDRCVPRHGGADDQRR